MVKSPIQLAIFPIGAMAYRLKVKWWLTFLLMVVKLWLNGLLMVVIMVKLPFVIMVKYNFIRAIYWTGNKLKIKENDNMVKGWLND